jgi:succinate dehydrogenase / fumarate reductase cytochrome b subunit
MDHLRRYDPIPPTERPSLARDSIRKSAIHGQDNRQTFEAIGRVQAMADVNRGNRPLSPHLTIYRPQLNSITSILVRITGNALIVGAVLLVWWLMAAASGATYFAAIDGLVTSIFGDLVMAGSVWALWYHALGGVRHLIWDTGRALDVDSADRLGWAMIIGSVVLTALTLIVI